MKKLLANFIPELDERRYDKDRPPRAYDYFFLWLFGFFGWFFVISIVVTFVPSFGVLVIATIIGGLVIGTVLMFCKQLTDYRKASKEWREKHGK